MKQNKFNYWKAVRQVLLPIAVATLVVTTCNNRTAGGLEKKQDLETKANSVAVVTPASNTVQNPLTYTIQKGDTLGNISKTYQIDFNRLKKANSGIDYNKLKLGQIINLPSNIRKYSISERGIEFIKAEEGFEPRVYDDVGEPAIGYGHRLLRGESFREINEPEADILLRRDVKEKYGVAVEDFVTVPLNQNQYDALCSFVYNNGVERFSNSGVLRELNRGDYKAAAERLKKYDKISYKSKDGKKRFKKVQRLTDRRQKEYELFLRQ